MSLVDLLTVTDVRRLTDHMLRITFTGRGLSELDTWPDQQLKLCFPRAGQTQPTLPAQDPDDVMRWYKAFLSIPEDERPWMRSFTVRRLMDDRMDIDFVLHGDNGPASAWAESAEPGDIVARYGPSAIYARPLGEAEWYLFAGDETAVPAVGTLLESLNPGTRASVYLAAEEQPLPSPGNATIHWQPRDTSVLKAVQQTDFPPTVYAWLAGEAGMVRALRRHLINDRAIPKTRIDFTGYWRRTLTQDDAPTAEDLAEAQERLST